MKNSDFRDHVYTVVRSIPKGEVMTYKQVAERVGRPNAYRAVGNVLNKNTDKNVPCHRVIKSDGRVGGYNGLKGKKESLLKVEGYKR
jgi:O-6-methylguanine DNA methyltransferase